MTIKTTLLTAAAAMSLGAVPALAQQSAPAGGAAASGAPSTGTNGASAGSPTGSAATTTTTQASVAAGATVRDTAGAEVGRVESVSGGNAVVNTGAHKVALPVTSFANGPTGPVIGMTKEQLDSAATGAQQQQQQQTRASLRAGQVVHDSSGAEVGTIKSVDAQSAVVDTTKHQVRVPLSGFGAGPNGPIIGATREQLDAAASAARPGQGGNGGR